MRSYRCIGAAFLGIVTGLAILATCSTSTYADTLTINVDNPSLQLNLSPISSSGTFNKSSNMTISVTTDNAVGYTLSFGATNGTNLTSGANTISSIGTVSGVTNTGISESDYAGSSNTQYNNTWAYKPSQIATGSYDDGDYTNTANTNYLPLPNSTIPHLLAITDTANPTTANSYTISMGARVSSDLPLGSYASDTFTITAVANVVPVIMQELTDAECKTHASASPLTVSDARDGNTYKVRWINGQCMMTQNLRFKNTTLTSNTSNVTETVTMNYGDLSSGDSYTEPRIHDSGNKTAGVWYNFCAAGAMVSGACSSSSYYLSSYDICPKNWRLPTNTQFSEITSYLEAFNPSNGGYYSGGSVNSEGLGYWWSNYPRNGSSQYILSYNGSSLSTTTSSKSNGSFVRCAMRSNYTIRYNANNGSGSMNDQVAFVGDITELSANTFVAPNGYEFAGWNTDAGGNGTRYANKASVKNITTAGEYVTLYAMWEKPCKKLYDCVARQSKGVQEVDDLKDYITKENSGVYEYDSSVFGESSDASNDKTIYYYRGILDDTIGSYGSDGDSGIYPNYVILDSDGVITSGDTGDTCWRIVRTTGSGGVKMIYNGKWTGSTCANSTTNARIVDRSFYNSSPCYYINFLNVGYTVNRSYCTSSATVATAYNTLFGTNQNPSVNNNNSGIKNYIENTWYSSSDVSAYESILEPSAGYCNDRTLNTGNNWTVPIDGSATLVPYEGTSDVTTYYFGSYIRNSTETLHPSLGCPRSTVDLYTTSAAADGNKQLSKPVALLTADEATFAGSGNGGAYESDENSFLRSGSHFWLLSPYHRNSIGRSGNYRVYSSGNLSYDNTDNSDGVRPVISLKFGAAVASGAGTATNPWVVTPPLPEMQNLAASECTTAASSAVDNRDGQAYTIQRLADGKCWMMTNLNLGAIALTTDLTSANTHLSTTITASTWNGHKKTSGSATYTAAEYITVSGNDTTSGTPYGTLYNYCAASAKTICSSSNSSNASYDICPAGWRLPTGDSSGEFQTLYSQSAYNTNAKMRTPIASGGAAFALAGRFLDSTPSSQGSSGYYWSSTWYDSANTRALSLGTSSIYPTGSSSRLYGLSIRCVLGS